MGGRREGPLTVRRLWRRLAGTGWRVQLLKPLAENNPVACSVGAATVAQWLEQQWSHRCEVVLTLGVVGSFGAVDWLYMECNVVPGCQEAAGK